MHRNRYICDRKVYHKSVSVTGEIDGDIEIKWSSEKRKLQVGIFP